MNAQAAWVAAEGEVPPSRLFAGTSVEGDGLWVYGGRDARGVVGGGFFLEAGRWEALSPERAPSPRQGHAQVSVGGGVCVWGGSSGRARFDDGACYQRSSGTWRPMGEGPLSARDGVAGFFDGSGVVLVGGRDADGETFGDNARWSLVTGAWEDLPPGPRPRHGATLGGVAPLGSFVVVGGAGEALALGAEDASMWSAQHHAWRPLDREGLPSTSEGPLVVATAIGVIVLGPHSGHCLNPATLVWEPLPDAPSWQRWGASVLATRDALWIVGGHDTTGLLADGHRFDLRTRTWSRLPPLPEPREDALLAPHGTSVALYWGRDARGLREGGLVLTGF